MCGADRGVLWSVMDCERIAGSDMCSCDEVIVAENAVGLRVVWGFVGQHGYREACRAYVSFVRGRVWSPVDSA